MFLSYHEYCSEPVITSEPLATCGAAGILGFEEQKQLSAASCRKVGVGETCLPLQYALVMLFPWWN